MATADAIFLICMAVALVLILFIASVLFFIKFTHPDDANMTTFPKFVVISSAMLAGAGVLLISLDFSNTELYQELETTDKVDKTNGLVLEPFWEALYIIIAVWLFALLPFALFYYEGGHRDEDEKEKEKVDCWDKPGVMALIYTFVIFTCFVVMLVILYAFIGDAEVTLTVNSVPASSMKPLSEIGKIPTSGTCSAKFDCTPGSATMVIPVSLLVYIMSFMAWFGWFFFTVFVGVGLGTLPMDLINEFRTRPQPMATLEYEDEKRRIGEQAKQLIERGRELKERQTGYYDEEKEKVVKSKKQGRNDVRELRKFEKDYFFLMREKDILAEVRDLKNGNPLWYFFKLLMGILGAIISFTWVLHICIYMLPEPAANPFLNVFFVYLATAIPGFSFFGLVFYVLWAYYLLACCYSGNFRLGLRFLCWKAYPLEINKTMMNAFLVNMWVVLLCSVALVQFLVFALPAYGPESSISWIFGSQGRHLIFFSLFWEYHIFEYIIVILAFLSLFFGIMCPINKSQNIDTYLAKKRAQDIVI